MAAQAIDRASQRVVLGGFMRAPHSAWALAEPKARSIFRFPCVPCALQKEAWPALASEENRCELHQQLNVMNGSPACALVVSGRSRRCENLIGNDLRSLAAGALHDDMSISCADWNARMYVRHLYQVYDLYVRTSVCLWDRSYTYVYLHRLRPL